MPKLNQKGVASVLVILLLLVGIGTSVYLVQKQTNLLPKAYSPRRTISSPIREKREYILIPSTSSTVYLTNGSISPSSYLATVILQDKFGKVVTDQGSMVYNWTASDSSIVSVLPSAYCAQGVFKPCPLAQAKLTGGVSGSATVRAIVTKGRDTIAQTSFNVAVIASLIPATGVILDKNMVEVTLDKANAQYGLIYGDGFKITSFNASGWAIKYNEPTSGQGFNLSSGGISPGDSTDIRSYISVNKSVGVYTGSAIVRYAKDGIWYDGPSITYKITLIDRSNSINKSIRRGVN